MNRRILIIVTCALVLSLCVSYLVYRAVSVKAAPGLSRPTSPVVVAVRDIEAGSLVRDVDLKIVAWSGPVPRGAIAKPESIRNRGVAAAIYEGEPITENRLVREGSGGGLAGTIPPGMRACAVRVNEVVGVAGFVVSGMRVDVLVTGQMSGGNPQDGPRVRTLLQNIQVLSAGTDYQPDHAGKPQQAQVVTLLVTPAQAETLSLASNETRIQLVLRNPMDTEIVQPPGVMVSDLFAAPREPARTPARSLKRLARPSDHMETTPSATPPVVLSSPPPFVVEELNGATHTQARFSSSQDQR